MASMAKHVMSKLGCILHACTFHPAGQSAFCIHVYSAQQASVHFAYTYNLASRPGCISHTCIFCPASQDAFHIHVYSTQLARVHFAYMYNLSSKPCMHQYTFLLASQDAFHIHVYSAQQARMHFTLYMYIPPGSLGSILHTCIFCPASQGAFCIHA